MLIAMIEPQRAIDHAGFGVPLIVVETAICVAVFEQIDLEAGRPEDIGEALIIVKHLVIGGRMIGRAGAADLHDALVLRVGEIGIRHGAA